MSAAAKYVDINAMANCVATRKHTKHCNIPDSRHFHLMRIGEPLKKLDLTDDNLAREWVKTGYCLQCGRTYHGLIK